MEPCYGVWWWWWCSQVSTVVNAILQFTTGQEGRVEERGSERASKSSPNQIPTTLSTCFAIALALWGACIIGHDGNVLPSTVQHSTAHSAVQLERLILYMDRWLAIQRFWYLSRIPGHRCTRTTQPSVPV